MHLVSLGVTLAIAVGHVLPARADLTSCVASLTYPHVQSPINYPPSDTSALSWDISYDPVACEGQFVYSAQLTTPSGLKSCNLPKNSIALDSSGAAIVTCPPVTRGTMQTGTWRPRTYLGNTGADAKDTSFVVTHNAAGPTPSPGYIRRRAERLGLRAPVEAEDACPDSWRLCNVGGQGRPMWQCVEPTSSLTSCGGCPGASGRDCSDIEGALDVQCVAGVCRVDICDDGYHLASNGTLCVSDF